MDWHSLLQDRTVLRDVVATLAVILVLLLAHAGVRRMIQRVTWARDEDRLRWRVHLRTALVLLIGVAVFLIWGSELRTLALSIVAVAAALVIATKELILCVTGTIYRFSSGAFTVGDRVVLGELHGDVVDTGLFSTRLLELGPGFERTGRSIVIPNSLLLSQVLRNETAKGDYVVHTIRVPLKVGDWKQADEHLQAVAEEVFREFAGAARAALAAVAAPSATRPNGGRENPLAPIIVLQPKTAEELELVLQMPVPVRRKGPIEQDVLRRFFERQRAVGG